MGGKVAQLRRTLSVIFLRCTTRISNKPYSKLSINISLGRMLAFFCFQRGSASAAFAQNIAGVTSKRISMRNMYQVSLFKLGMDERWL